MRIFLFLLLIVSCACRNLSQAPVMERKIKIWNGAPEVENGSICRLSTPELAHKINGIEMILKRFHKGTRGIECISCSHPDFKKYAGITFEDLGVLYDYIQTLIYECKEWRK